MPYHNQADIAAEGNHAQAVLGVPAHILEEGRAKTEAEPHHPDPESAGGQEVAELVDRHQDTHEKEEVEERHLRPRTTAHPGRTGG